MTGFLGSPRVDSAHEQGGVSYENVEVSQVVAASSVNPPWSGYNTRDQPEHNPPYALSTPYRYAYPNSNRADHDHDTFAFAFGVETLLRCTSPEAATQSSYSTRTSESPLPASSGAIASSSSPVGKYSSNNATSCGQCGKEYTGIHGPRNLSRHIAQKHEDQNRFPCRAAGCSKVYRRQDARKKHVRNKHTELQPSLVQRQYNPEQGSRVTQVVEHDCIVQESSYQAEPLPEGDQASSNHHTARVPVDLDAPPDGIKLPPLAGKIVVALKEKLTPSDHSRLWNTFFARWTCIMQQLWDDQSVAYPVYFQVMEDIRTAVQAVEDTTDSFYAADPSGYSNRAAKRQQTRPHVNAHSKQAHGAPITSPTDRISKRSGRKPSMTGASGKDVLVDTDDLDNINKDKKVDCPVYKHHRMYGTTSPCSGFCSSSMSQVRHHLNHGRGHKTFPECVQQCSHCKQEFVERRAYEQHTSRITCTSSPQFRGDKDVPWALLYLALHPDAQHVPLPGHGDIGWLPASIVAICQEFRGRSSVSAAFLGEGQDLSRSRQPTQTTGVGLSNQVYDTAMQHALGTLVLPPSVQSAHHVTPHDQIRPSPPTSPLSMSRESRSEHLLEVLHDLETFYRTVRRAASYLSQEDLHTLAAECTQIAAHTRSLSDRNDLPSTHDELPAIVYDGLSVENNSTVQMTPDRSHHHLSPGQDRGPFGTPDTSDHGQFATPSTSQLPSNRSHETQFSLRFHRSTLPSSTTNEHLPQSFLDATTVDDCSPVPLALQDGERSLGYSNWRSPPETPQPYVNPAWLVQRGGDADASNSWSLPLNPIDFNDPTLPSPWGDEGDPDADDDDVKYGS